MNEKLYAVWRQRVDAAMTSLENSDDSDALLTIVRLSERLASGGREHGRLNVADSRRKWLRELQMELYDAIIYAEFQLSKDEHEAAEELSRLGHEIQGVDK